MDIEYDSILAEQALQFMFADIGAEESVNHPTKTFQLIEKNGNWHCISDTKTAHQAVKIQDAASDLMGEVVFHLIENNLTHLAVHAGYVSDKDGGIMIPGESGHGKSSLSIWMTANGYRYHTDELILLESGSSQVKAFSRPFNIKKHGLDAIGMFVDIDALGDKVMRGGFVNMIAHRAINPNFNHDVPALSRILFPRYHPDAANTITPLSRAMAGIELMKSNVIGRNLPEHGFDQLLDIVRSVQSYRLDYNDFSVLPVLLEQLKIRPDEQ